MLHEVYMEVMRTIHRLVYSLFHSSLFHFDLIADDNPLNRKTILGAKKRGNQYILSGMVDHIPLIDIADGFIVAARIDRQTGIFLLDRETLKLDIDFEDMADGTQSGKIRFENTILPENSLIATGEEANEAISHSYQASSLCTSAYLNGLSERLLEITLDYLKTREQFGKPIGATESASDFSGD